MGAALTVCAEVSAAILLIEYWNDSVWSLPSSNEYISMLNFLDTHFGLDCSYIGRHISAQHFRLVAHPHLMILQF